MDVLIFNTVPKQSENLIVDFLKKKVLLYTQLSSGSCQFHFLSFVVLTGDPVGDRSYPLTRMIAIANKMHVSSNKEIPSFAKFS